jgi:Holliday junction DNA helicase RuvA
MIAYLRGRMAERHPGRVVVDIGGIGYAVFVPDSTLRVLPRAGADVTLLTCLHVREDALHLYGFSTQAERTLFERLQDVSGVGPKVALAVLSTLSVDVFQRAVQDNAPRVLTVVPGVGKRLAERLVVELRDRLSPHAQDAVASDAGGLSPAHRDQALEALIALGVQRATAVDLVNSAGRNAGGEASAEDIVRRSLATLAGRT